MARVLRRGAAAATETLGFRPDIHLDWPDGASVTAAVARAVQDALDLSLARIADRGGSTSAIVSLVWRSDTVELCVVDDGRAAGVDKREAAHLVDARGLEHDVDDFVDVGVCQWWSIPVDLS